LRIIALLDRSIKGVHVDMDDFSHNLPATILFRVPNQSEYSACRAFPTEGPRLERSFPLANLAEAGCRQGGSELVLLV
jgi:hypothetical protein